MLMVEAWIHQPSSSMQAEKKKRVGSDSTVSLTVPGLNSISLRTWYDMRSLGIGLIVNTPGIAGNSRP